MDLKILFHQLPKQPPLSHVKEEKSPKNKQSITTTKTTTMNRQFSVLATYEQSFYGFNAIDGPSSSIGVVVIVVVVAVVHVGV